MRFYLSSNAILLLSEKKLRLFHLLAPRLLHFLVFLDADAVLHMARYIMASVEPSIDLSKRKIAKMINNNRETFAIHKIRVHLSRQLKSVYEVTAC